MISESFVRYVKKNISIKKKELLKSIYENILVLLNYLYDISRYYRYSGMTLNFNNKEKLRAVITINYHVIEKGLSLHSPRSGFGQPILKRLVYFVDTYVSLHGCDSTILFSISTIKKYIDFHRSLGIRYEYLEFFLSKYEKLIVDNDGSLGGVKTIEKKDILSSLGAGFRELAFSRHSIRDFDEGKIPDATIKEAIYIARKTPSVCNRPTTKIYVYNSSEMKEKILSVQSGNRGFGDRASHIILVASELACFNGAKERNQSFIDGGLMAMSLVYSLHSLGLGTCFLNWSVGAMSDLRLRKIVSIPASNNIITLIAVGVLPTRFNVAQSNKVEFDDVVFFE